MPCNVGYHDIPPITTRLLVISRASPTPKMSLGVIGLCGQPTPSSLSIKQRIKVKEMNTAGKAPPSFHSYLRMPCRANAVSWGLHCCPFPVLYMYECSVFQFFVSLLFIGDWERSFLAGIYGFMFPKRIRPSCRYIVIFVVCIYK